MKTLILEGIATSGKSTILHKVSDMFDASQRLKIVPETETLMPIVNNIDKATGLKYLMDLLETVYARDYDFVVFDRLYLTQVHRTFSSMTDFKPIEEMLRPFRPETIFLEIDETAIADRVARAAEHREPEWKEYIFTKGETIDEIAKYYISQQRSQLKNLRESTLPYRIFNTTDHKYQKVIEEINDFRIS